MRMRLVLSLVPVGLLPMMLFSACSGGDDDSSPTPDPSGDPTAAPGTEVGATLRDCTVTTYISQADYEFTTDASYRYLEGNGIPDHAVGAFPNSGNPNTISAQEHSFRMPLKPSGAGVDFVQRVGISVNGILFEPSAGEFYNDDPSSGWQYEALSGALDLGVDCNHAHVQPTGNYHFHGMPEKLIEALGGDGEMLLVGYAADGYPMYARYGYSDPDDASSAVRKMISSYKLKEGTRPSGPGGEYDGSFTADYEYVEGLGDLDECNGRTGVTPDFGTTYHYFLTDNYPWISRCTKAEPDDTFGGDMPPPPPGKVLTAGTAR